MEKKSDIGLIGLAVMGQNLVLNMADHGYRVSVFNRTVSKVDEFLQDAAKGNANVIGTRSIEEFTASLERPRKVMLMVKAGEVVDKFIETLLPHLEEGDIIIDGGNSFFQDTRRRTAYLKEKGFLYIGTGVSGGEEGARKGPSIMPGGNQDAWKSIQNIFQDISAKTNDGDVCCNWVGSDGAGHFVKMVHNGIEYGDMQLICEAYWIMKQLLKLPNDRISDIFAEWNKGELDSYLIEITTDILKFKEEDGSFLVDKILDTAGQKGTGKWTTTASLDQGIPVTLIGESVFARFLSALKDERVKASGILTGPEPNFEGDVEAFVEDIRRALYAAKIVSYAQGFMLLRDAAKEYKWELNYGDIALMWRGGCIIRSNFLGDIKKAFVKNPDLSNLLLDDYFKQIIEEAQGAWRKVAAAALTGGISIPALTSALTFFDGYRAARLPANLLQAQRDYFGAHTYERLDKPRGEFFHTNWTGTGGNVSSSTYNA